MLSWDYEARSARHLDLTKVGKTKEETMRDYNKTYREKHSAVVTCGCGAEFKEISKYTHVKTARHLNWLKDKG